MSTRRGSSLVEALVALALVAVAMAAVAATAATVGTALRTARAHDAAHAAVADVLERLRTGPRADGEDVVTIGHTTVRRHWRITPGRGEADEIAATAAWPTGSFTVATAVLP